MTEAQKGLYNLVKLTPRLILQLLGTNVGRQIIHPNIWVTATLGNYHEDAKWICTDVRFPNEADAIKTKGGILIKIVRPCIECGGLGCHKMGCSIGIQNHVSETSLDKYDGFDYIIENIGTIDDLIEKVKKILINESKIKLNEKKMKCLMKDL